MEDIFERIELHFADTAKRLDGINDKLDKISNDISNLEKEVSRLNDITSNVEKSTSNMDNHINFVNGVYDQIKNPFHRAMNIISWKETKMLE